MDFALMAPALLAVPMAIAHLPTTAAALVAATVWVTVAEAGKVMLMVVGAGGVAEPAALWPLRNTPLTRIVEPAVELTMPVALAKARRAPEPAEGAPEGAPPVRRGNEPAPPPGTPPPKAPEALQAPLTFAMIRTEVAVNPDVEPVAGAPVTVTQSPAATWPVVVWVNLVLAVYTTVF
jgi:hypothetical protein